MSIGLLYAVPNTCEMTRQIKQNCMMFNFLTLSPCVNNYFYSFSVEAWCKTTETFIAFYWLQVKTRTNCPYAANCNFLWYRFNKPACIYIKQFFMNHVCTLYICIYIYYIYIYTYIQIHIYTHIYIHMFYSYIFWQHFHWGC